MPNEDLSNHVPWLESKRRSRARRKEARQARSRDRRRKTGAIVAAATLTFAAGGALAQSGGDRLERRPQRGLHRRRAAVRPRHHARRRLRPEHAPRRAQLPAQPGPRRRRHRRPGDARPSRPRELGLGRRDRSSGTASNGATATAPNATLAKIAACESGGNPAAVSASGQYRGKYQFSRQTWAEYGGTGDPAAAPESVQDPSPPSCSPPAARSPGPSAASNRLDGRQLRLGRELRERPARPLPTRAVDCMCLRRSNPRPSSAEPAPLPSRR